MIEVGTIKIRDATNINFLSTLLCLACVHNVMCTEVAKLESYVFDTLVGGQ